MDLGRLFANTLPCSLLLYLTVLPGRSIGQKTAILIKEKKSNSTESIKEYTDSFTLLLFASNMVVDRSLFIKELLEHPEKRLIITCPPKWSKSVNLHMLKMFLQMEVNSHGKKIYNMNTTFAYKTFKYGYVTNSSHSTRFKSPFLISKHQNFVDEHLGQHPVVYVRCKFIDGSNYAEIFDSLRMLLKRVYTPHTYLVGVLTDYYGKLDETQTLQRMKAENYTYHFQGIVKGTETNEHAITQSLATLCKLLYRLHGKRVIVLIDDYDTLFYKSLHCPYFRQSDMKSVLQLMQNMFDPILDENNPHVERVIIAGTYRFTDILGPTFAALPDYTLANNPWLEYFAITDSEQRQLCKEHGCCDRRCKNVADWYMGYKYTLNQTLSMGSPFSTARFLHENNMSLYLSYKLRIDYIYQFCKIRALRDILESLINENIVTIQSFNQLRFSEADMRRIKEIAIDQSPQQRMSRPLIDLALSYLCAAGYLTFVKPNDTDDTAIAWLPNMETNTEISRHLKAHYSQAYGLSHQLIELVVHKLRDFFVKDNDKNFAAMVKNLHHFLNTTKPADSNDTVQYHQDMMHAALNYISFKLRSVWKFECLVWKEGTPYTSYMVAAKDNIGVIVATQFNRSADHLLTLAKQQEMFLQKYQHHLQVHKFIGYSLNYDKIFSIRTGFQKIV